ncbi:Uma2 family endonuclease [Streptomyces sp. MAR4 CNY-716]
MTVMAERTSQATVAHFEEIARHADKVTDKAVRLEFVAGKIREKPVADGDHDTIIMWLLRRCMQSRPELGLFAERRLKVEAYREGRAIVDGVLAPWEHFAGQGEWAEPDGVLMTVEVTSFDSDTDSRDRREKPSAYAAVGIPVHLLVDRSSCTVTVFTNPDTEHSWYQDAHTAPFGESVVLPDPVNIELDTEGLKNYVR